MAADETAYFRFDTNADAVANDIDAAMGRIKASLGKASGTSLDGLLAPAETRRIQESFGGVESSLKESIGRVQNLMSQGLGGSAFRSKFREEVRGSIGQIPSLLADVSGKLPATQALRTPFSAIGRDVGNVYVQSLLDTVKAANPELAKGLRPSDFTRAINTVGKTPVAFGTESDPVAALRNRLRVEELAASAYKQGKGVVSNNVLQAVVPSHMQDAVKKAVDEAKASGRAYTEGGKSTYDLSAIKAETSAAEKESLATERAISRELKAQATDLARQEAAQVKLAEIEAKRAEVTARQSAQQNAGFLGGFQNRFQKGGSTFSTAIGESVASAAKFSLAYGSIFAAQAGGADILKQFLDYQDSLTDLQVAVGDSDKITNDFQSDLTELARTSGSNVGEAMDTAAKAVRAFGGGAKLSKAEIQDIGDAATEASTKLALITGKTLPDSTGDLIAAGTAFGLKPDELDQVTDAVANAKRNVGGDAGQISQGLALIANSAQEAGFTLNEAASVIGLVQARTDESGQAIATRLTKIFQIMSGSTGKALASELSPYGVDPNASTKDQLTSYASIYSSDTTPKAIKDRISSQLGGTANLRELLPLLKEMPKLQAAFKSAIDNSGQGTSEFDRKLHNLNGTLKEMGADLKAIEVGAATSGIFDPFGAALKTAEPFLHTLAQILEFWKGMPGPIKTSVGAILDFYAVSKVVSAYQAHNVAKGGLAAAGGAVGAAEAGGAGVLGVSAAVKAAEAEVIAAKELEAKGVIGAAEARAAAEARMDEVIAGASIARGEAETVGRYAAFRGNVVSKVRGAAQAGEVRYGMGSLVGGLLNPYTLAAGAVLGGAAGYQYIHTGFQQKNAFRDTYSDESKAFARSDGSSVDLKKLAQDLNTAAGTVKKSDANIFSKGERKDVSEKLDGQYKAINVIANAVAAEERANAAKASTSVFGTGPIETVDQLSRGLSELQTSGQNARTQVRLLAKALDSTATPDTVRRFQPQQFAAEVTSQINPALKKALGKGVDDSGKVFLKNTNGGAYAAPIATDVKDAYQQLSLSGKQLKQFNQAMLDYQSNLGLKAGAKLTPNLLRQSATYAANEVNLSDLPKSPNQDPLQVRNKLIENLLKGLGKSDKSITASTLLNGNGALNSGQIQSLLNPSKDNKYAGLPAILQAGLQDIPAGDDGAGKLAAAKQNLKIVQGLKGRYKGPDLTQFNDLVNQTEYDFAQAKIAELEKLRKVAQNNPKLNPAQLRSIGMRYLKQEIQGANGQLSVIISVMEQADKSAVAAVIDQLQAAKDMADAAEAKKQELYDAQQYLSRRGPSGQGGMDRKKLPKSAAQKKADSDLSAAKKAQKEALIPDDNNPGDIITGGNDLGTPAERNAAAYAARMAALGGDLANGRAAIESARVALNQARPGTVAFFQAQQSLYEAQQQYSQSVLSYKTILDQLHGDLTDPVENARDVLREANRKLNADKGKGADVTAQDRLDKKNAQNSLEAAKFSQRLSDAQTANDLGKISNAAYLKYLDDEHDRLTAIKHKSRQQIDELNQIDEAIKSANDAAQGQFNLGDINTNGLVYQVRRQAAEARATAASTSLSSSSTTTRQTVTISVNGADTAKVQQIIKTYLNAPTHQNQTLTRRKV